MIIIIMIIIIIINNNLAFLFHLPSVPLVAGMEMNLIQEMENVKHVLYTKFKKVLSFGNFIRHDSIITYIYYTDKNNIHFALVLRQFFCFTGVSRLLGERPTLRCSRSKLRIWSNFSTTMDFHTSYKRIWEVENYKKYISKPTLYRLSHRNRCCERGVTLELHFFATGSVWS